MNPVQAYERGKADAAVEARRQARAEVLSMLEKRYMDTAIERNSPTAVAILEVAKGVAEEYRESGI